MATQMKTPGVYISEREAFSSSAVSVPTAVPAFIGYTPTATYNGKSCLNQPVRITSFNEFRATFLLPGTEAAPYHPQYYLTRQQQAPSRGEHYLFNGEIYTLEPDPATIYYLYNSMRLFYSNGGGTAYIVSVGTYGTPSGQPVNPGESIVNPNVKLQDLLNGLATLKKEPEVTLYIVPEATLLSPADNSTLMRAMLQQNGEMRTAVSVFDIPGSDRQNPGRYPDNIAHFREAVGMDHLSYGAAYYPFVISTIIQPGEITYRNINGGDIKSLEPVLNPPQAPDPAVAGILAQSENNRNALTPEQRHKALMAASPTYTQIITILTTRVNTLPPGGAMAGAYTLTDNNIGVWKAPANISLRNVADLTLHIDFNMQENLNTDLSGKSINVLRFFIGEGILVWGARTLDGNSQDWRYINVRRTMIMLEQSIKQAVQAYVFAPNDAHTWATVKAMVNNFLTGLWKQGALVGASPADAFDVSVGLGSTMTADDILNGYMNISVRVAVIRPAEFIVITFQQQMQKS